MAVCCRSWSEGEGVDERENGGVMVLVVLVVTTVSVLAVVLYPV